MRERASSLATSSANCIGPVKILESDRNMLRVANWENGTINRRLDNISVLLT